ncbi:MAG: translocation/assembly module TamB domain-containing protein [Acidobacteria bacterium]|nr:translocation/assembly module TamB domain-containing protein [Acidobacteriota bacterium]
MNQTPLEQSAKQPKTSRWRKRILIALLCLLTAGAAAGMYGWYWLRSEKFNRFVAEEIKKKLTEFGLRGEVGSFGFAWDSETARLKDLKVYNQQTGQLIASVNSIEIQLHIRDLYAPKLSREVEIQTVKLDGAEVFVEFDERGRSNLDGIHEAPPKSETLKFDTTKLLTALTNTAVHFKDRQHDIAADLSKLQIEMQPAAGQPQRFNLKLGTVTGRVAIEGRETPISKLNLAAKASASALEVERLQLTSGLGEITASGKVDDLRALRYGFEIESGVKTEELARFAFPEVTMRGLVSAKGKLEGEGRRYKFNGGVSAADLLVDTTRLRGVQLPQVTVNGENKQLKLALNRANVQTINVDVVEISGVSVGIINGEIAINGKATESKFDAPLANVAAVTWTDSKLSDLTLSKLTTTVRGKEYKVTADARLPGGQISGIEFTDASANAEFDNTALALTAIKANALGGTAEAEYTLPLAKGAAQQVKGSFTDIQTASALAAFRNLGKMKDSPISGKTSGTAELSFVGANPRTIDGKISAHFEGKSDPSSDAIPLTGDVAITANRGVFQFDQAQLATAATKMTATGTLSYEGESDLRVALVSTQSEELIQIARSIEQARPFIVENEPQLLGDLKFDGRITGKLDQAIVAGDVSAATVGLRDALIGALSGKVTASKDELRIVNGTLTALNGGSAKFDLYAPLDPKSEAGTLEATINRISLDTILAATGLPDAGDFIAGDLSGQTSLTGLPGALRGTAKVSLVDGTISGQAVNLATAELKFDGQQALLEPLEVQLPKTHLVATGSFHLKDFVFQAQGKADQIALDSLAESFQLKDTKVEGFADANFQVVGKLEKPDQTRKQPELDWETFKVELTAVGKNVRVNGRDTGELRLTAHTSPGGRIDAELVTGILAEVTKDKSFKPEKLKASIELRKPGRPVIVESDLVDLDLTPLIATFAPELGSQLRGVISGKLRVEGMTSDEAGNATADLLKGGLTLTAIKLDVLDNPVTIAAPLTITLDQSQLKLPATRITGQGLDLNLGGAIGLKNEAVMNFDLNGSIALDRLPTLAEGVALFGTVNIGGTLTGTAEKPVLGGLVEFSGFGLSTADLPIFVSNGRGRIKLSGDDLIVESFKAEANDGALEITGGMKLAQLRPANWKFDIRATNAEIFYDEFSATVNGTLTLTGTPEKQVLAGTILVPLGEYETRIDLDNLIGGGNANLSFGGFSGSGSSSQQSVIPPIMLELKVEARDSLLVRGEQINAVGSAKFTVGGTLSDPDAEGRIETESGSVRFRGQRYEITKGNLELPQGGGEPSLNLVAESEISGYRVYLDMSGKTNAIELKLRSEPLLTRDEILSLITTGRTETGTIGSQDPLRTGVGAAASLLSSGFISKPTEQLLGLSRFQIDPVIRANANPAARLTVGQQLSRNIYLSYSTNLATEQDQTALAEYTFSNRFSGLATYTQGGSAARQGVQEGVFSIELRGRQRFSLGFIAPAPDPTLRDTIAATGANARPKLPTADVKVSPVPNLKLDNKKLRELLPVMSQGFSRSLARLGERRLTEYLQEQGYFFANVAWRCNPSDCAPGKELALTYDITPNLIYDLKEIRIEGTKLIRWQDIRGDLQSQVESKVGGIPYLENIPFIGGTVRGLTSDSRLRSDEEYIRRYLVDVGYRNARVNTRLAVKPDNDDLIVIFDVQEGSQSDIADVTFRGNTILTANELRQVVPIQKNEAFSLTRARLGAQAVKQLYAERGYLDTDAELQILDLDEDSVALVYRIEEGSRAVVENIEIKGISKTGPGWIRRYFDFKPGDVLTPAKIARTQRDLYSTNAFREVAIRAIPIADANGKVGSAQKVQINLTEAKPLLFVYGLGYSTDDGARGLMEIANTNLGGSLDALSLRLRASQREQFAQLSFTDLRPFSWRLPTTISIFYDRNGNLLPFTRQRQLRDGQVENVPNRQPFGLERFAAFIQTERKLDDRVSLRFRYNLERAKLFNTTGLPDTEITRNEQAIRLGMFSIGFTRDSRDNILNPTRGQLISADHSIASEMFGGNESFNKFFGTFQRYHTFAPYTSVLANTTFAFSARIGLADTFRLTDRNNNGSIEDSERRLPISERFFSGGATTLRGFRFETAGPQDVLFNPNQTPAPGQGFLLPTLVPIGGDALAVFNFEMRYPLTQRLRLVPFYDLGNVFRRINDIRWKNMSHTVGAGLRINTPLGPVGVDYGFLLNPPSYAVPGVPGAFLQQPRGAIHIRFGQTF